MEILRLPTQSNGIRILGNQVWGSALQTNFPADSCVCVGLRPMKQCKPWHNLWQESSRFLKDKNPNKLKPFYAWGSNEEQRPDFGLRSSCRAKQSFSHSSSGSNHDFQHLEAEPMDHSMGAKAKQYKGMASLVARTFAKLLPNPSIPWHKSRQSFLVSFVGWDVKIYKKWDGRKMAKNITIWEF